MNAIAHKTLSSSLLKSAGWADGTLEIVFTAGGKYRYSDVPESVWEEFMAADSAGKFFLSSIKGKFEYEKIDEEDGS